MTDVLASQIDYYDARADVYDDFWTRRGSYRLEEPYARWWVEDADETLRFVAGQARGDVLELAAGTGIFTEHLHRAGHRVHAVDASPRMLEQNRRRLGGAVGVTYELADLFAWRPGRRYDTVFFGFWLSHVPDDRLADFTHLLRECLTPDGQVVFVDSRPRPDASGTATTRVEERRLDAATFHVVKRYWTPTELQEQFAALGWTAEVGCATHDLILYGTASVGSPS